MTREISIRNAHPRLRVPRAAVAKAIALMDAQFEMVAADLPQLTLPRARLAALRARGGKPFVGVRGACPAGELSLVFLTDAALAKIHGDFMADPTATDVITFEGEPLAGLAGEICVSADTAARYVGLLENPRTDGTSARLSPARCAGQQALQLQFAAELTLYLVHGWLHLAGYDDLKPAKKRRMRAAEARAMKLLHQAKALPAFQLAY